MKTLNPRRGMLAIMAAMLLSTAPAMADVKVRMVERRAIEAAVWGMPIVNFQAMRDGMKQGAGVGHDTCASSSKVQTWQLLTIVSRQQKSDT